MEERLEVLPRVHALQALCEELVPHRDARGGLRVQERHLTGDVGEAASARDTRAEPMRSLSLLSASQLPVRLRSAQPRSQTPIYTL